MGKPAGLRGPGPPRTPSPGPVREGTGGTPNTPGTYLPRELGKERAGKQKKQMKVNRPGTAERDQEELDSSVFYTVL